MGSDKTLGQVAFEAWHLEHMCPGLTAPYNWGQEYPDGRKAWEAAAEAVRAKVVSEERAVIEAAKAAKTVLERWVYDEDAGALAATTDMALRLLLGPIEALEGVESD